MQVDNCVRWLMLADTYDADVLKQRASDFIVGNISKVVDTEGYAQARRGDCDLGFDLFERALFPENHPHWDKKAKRNRDDDGANLLTTLKKKFRGAVQAVGGC